MKQKKIEMLERSAAFIERMGCLDDLTKLALADQARNAALGTQQPDPGEEEITIAEIAMELGHRLDRSQSIIAGKYAKQKYKDVHSEDPPKRKQFVDGAPRFVNSYKRRDSDLLVDAIFEALGM